MTSQPQSAAGTPHSRVDGRLKVTGHAMYAADHAIDGVVYAAVVDSSVGRGRITGVDTRAALAQPGVLRVLSHRNAPRLPYRDNPGSNNPPGHCIHEMGGARMSRTPDEGVLNAWNQAWDVPNLFVTDGACMASCACQNPSITYMAITARAAAHAVDALNRREL